MKNWEYYFDLGASVSSILGLLGTLYVIYGLKKIKDRFTLKARLPELNNDLRSATSELFNNLKKWQVDNKLAINSLSKIKGLLVSIKRKLPKRDRKKITSFLSSVHPKQGYFKKGTLSSLTEDEVWDRYTTLNELVTTLEQLYKDTKWD